MANARTMAIDLIRCKYTKFYLKYFTDSPKKADNVNNNHAICLSLKAPPTIHDPVKFGVRKPDTR